MAKSSMLKIIPPLNRFGCFLIGGMLLGLASFSLFLAIAEDEVHRELGLFDQSIISVFINFRSPELTRIMKIITDLGAAPVLIVVAVVVAWLLFDVKRHSWDASVLIVALSGASFMNWMLKLGFHRDRPGGPSLAQALGYSFPSGHAMVSLVFYGMIIYLIWVNFRRGLGVYVMTIFLAVLIMSIGISRIYLGVHYPSDVIAGYAAGGCWLSGCILGLHTIRHLHGKLELH
jgi:Membrane-associated phospholipid phosphatase